MLNSYMVQCPHEDCSDSNKEFQSDVTMRQHHTKVHDEQLPNCECDECEKEFFKKNGRRKYCDGCKYDEHYEGENNPNYSGAKEETECNECEGEFSYYPSEKEGNFCSDCVRKTKCPHPDCRDSDKEFASDSTMRQHHTLVHNEQLPNSECGDCGDEFFRRSGGTYCDDCKDKTGVNKV